MLVVQVTSTYNNKIIQAIQDITYNKPLSLQTLLRRHKTANYYSYIIYVRVLKAHGLEFIQIPHCFFFHHELGLSKNKISFSSMCCQYSSCFFSFEKLLPRQI